MNASQSQPVTATADAATSGAEPSAAFVPGPWELREYGSPRGTYFIEAGPTRILSSMKCGETNARLIAAAPDLLEGLIAAKRALWADARQSWTLSDFKNWGVVQQIDGALNKARGRDAASPAGAQPKAPDEPKPPSLGTQAEQDR